MYISTSTELNLRTDTNRGRRHYLCNLSCAEFPRFSDTATHINCGDETSHHLRTGHARLKAICADKFPRGLRMFFTARESKGESKRGGKADRERGRNRFSLSRRRRRPSPPFFHCTAFFSLPRLLLANATRFVTRPQRLIDARQTSPRYRVLSYRRLRALRESILHSYSTLQWTFGILFPSTSTTRYAGNNRTWPTNFSKLEFLRACVHLLRINTNDVPSARGAILYLI